MPNPDLFRILGHASLRLAVMIVSGNHGSRFLYARVSCLWKTRCSKCRLAQISCHTSYQDQWLRSFPRDFATYPVPCLLSSGILISRCVKCDGTRSLTPVSSMDGPDLIVVSRLEWPRCLVPRISETDDLVTRAPLQPDVLDLLLGFRDFRSPVSLALRIFDSPIPDSSGSLATCPLDQRPMMV
jgi:hypothetical protein